MMWVMTQMFNRYWWIIYRWAILLMYWSCSEYYCLPSRNYFLIVKKVVTPVNAVLLFPSSVVLLVLFLITLLRVLLSRGSGFILMQFTVPHIMMRLIVQRRTFISFFYSWGIYFFLNSPFDFSMKVFAWFGKCPYWKWDTLLRTSNTYSSFSTKTDSRETGGRASVLLEVICSPFFNSTTPYTKSTTQSVQV